MSNNETITRIFIIMMCMNAALVLSGVQTYSTGTDNVEREINFTSELDRVSLHNSTRVSNGLVDDIRNWIEDTPFIGPLIGLYNFMWYMANFLLAGGLIGFFYSSGMPYEIQLLVGGPVTALCIMSTLFVIRQFWRK